MPSEKEGAPSWLTAITLLGELANPRRPVDIGAGPLPIINVRIDDICRTWTDLDPYDESRRPSCDRSAHMDGGNNHLGFGTPQVRQLMEHL